MIAIILISLGCVSCNSSKEEKHTHSFSSSWKNNEISHWHECTECGEHSDDQVHDFIDIYDGNFKYEKCSVCGYQRVSEDYGNRYKFTLLEDGTYSLVSLLDKNIEGSVAIPSTNNGMPITVIAIQAITQCHKLKEIYS